MSKKFVTNVTKELMLKAAERIKPYKHVTPLLTCQSIDKEAGCNIYFKCENFQKTNAFKVRGSSNSFLALKERFEEEGKELKGVCTISTGNHAGGFAYITNKFNFPNKVVMPSNAPLCKINNVRNYNGDIVFCEPTEKAS